VRKILEAPDDRQGRDDEEEPRLAEPGDGLAGDDDDLEELDIVSRPAPGEQEPVGDFDEDFYATALKDADD
jgi:hypothetical protein